MIKVSIVVRSGAASFEVAVQAGSIERALGLVRGRYPGGAVRVKFPLDPETFFLGEPARAGLVRPPEKMAA